MIITNRLSFKYSAGDLLTAFVFTINALLAPLIVLADSKEVDLDAVTQRLETVILHEIAKGIPSMSVSIVKGGEVVWSAAYGYSNMRMKVPATVETIYVAASTFKSVTATALLMLAEQGKCSLDDPVNKFLHGNKIREKKRNSITIRHILNHTSGLKSGYTTVDLWDRELPRSLEEIVSKLEPERAPGEAYDYNNAGYALAGLLIEKISGKTFEDFVVEEILVPLGAKTPQPVNPSANMQEMIAVPYMFNSDVTLKPAPRLRFDVFPAGDVYLTAEDMGRVLAMHLNGGVYKGKRLLSEASIEEAHRSYLENYGLGWELKEDKHGNRLIWHDGGVPGFGTHIIGDKDNRIGVYVMSNVTSYSHIKIAEAAMTLLHGEKYTLTPGLER